MTQATQQHGRRLVALAAAIAIAVVLLCAASGFATQRALEYRRARIASQPLGVFWEAWDTLERSFYGALPSARVRTYGAIRGALALLDSHTIFLEPQPGEVERDRLTGAYGGIGVDIWRNSEGEPILSPYPDSPAARAGVRQNDRLIAIDSRPVLTATIDEIRVRLRGEVGTQVCLTISRPPTPPIELTVVRDEIRIPSVTYRVLDQHPTVGYLQISQFTERTPDEAHEALIALKAAGVSQLVLDLRDNGGGLISPAVSVVDLFLDGGIVLIEIRHGGAETTVEASPGGIASDMSIVVLVNHSTASAAETVAGALQRRGRARLVGDPTYGKGSVQLIFALSDGSSLHVTSAKWLLPDREPVEPDGLTPDIPVPQTDALDDAQLERAVQYLERGE
jgi:carboxyl-terminal processing protease